MLDAKSADDPIRQNRASWDERAVIHHRDTTGFYAVERFIAGEDILLPIESREIGDVSGMHLLHLQCHIGLDTLCLARRGAIVTGLDFSGVAIAAARDIAERAKLPAYFVEADVYQAPQKLLGAFDGVYVSWGSLNWLPDLDRWAQTALPSSESSATRASRLFPARRQTGPGQVTTWDDIVAPPAASVGGVAVHAARFKICVHDSKINSSAR